MFTVTLYQFKKKPNSTAVPGSEAVSRNFTCYALDNSSIIHPTLVLQYGIDDILSYNYAYIPSWGRYYFIGDIAVLEGGIYQLQMDVDALATYRTDILNSSQYVLRSASSSDGSIIDNLYPLKATNSRVRQYATGDPVIDSTTPVPTYFDGLVASGCYVLTIVSNNTSGITSYALDSVAFRSLMSILMTFVPSDMSDVSTGIGKQLFDPMQYIVSCQWFPTFPEKSPITSTNTINFGGYSITGITGTLGYFDASAWDEVYIDIDVPKHTDAASYPYTQLEPFSRYSLYFEPFGSFDLDSTKLYGVSTVRCRWTVEYQKGYAHLDVFDKSNPSNIIARADSVLGITIPVTQISTDLISTGSSILRGAVNTGVNMLTGNIVGAIGSAIGAIGNSIASMSPNSQTRGTPDSFLSYRGDPPCITAQFMDSVSRDASKFGAPLCQTVALNTLSGYTMCQSAVIQISGTDEENQMIVGELNSGVYLE